MSDKGRKIVQKLHRCRVVVDSAAIVRQAVGNNDVGCPVDVVVAGNLVENGLRQGYMGCFAPDNK